MSKLGIKAHKCLKSKHLTQILLNFPILILLTAKDTEELSKQVMSLHFTKEVEIA